MEIQKLIIILQMCIYNVFCDCYKKTNTKYRVTSSLQKPNILLSMNDIHQWLDGTYQIADVDYARVTTLKLIDCCARNYMYLKILWYFMKTGDSTWHLFSRKNTEEYALRNRNQTLVIKRIGLSDEGVYKCVAFSGQNVIIDQHTTTLNVYSCTDRIKPEAYGPMDKYTIVGQLVTFKCTGDFGCDSDSGRDIAWYDEKWQLLSNTAVFPRYEVITIERAKHTIVESYFTFKASKEDFLKTFRCVVSSSYTRGDKTFKVRLRKTSVNITRALSPDQIAAVGTALLVVLILTIVIVVLFYPRIKLFIRSRLPYWHLDDIGDNTFHALILHEESDEDLEFARTIQKQLEADSYRIKLVGEILGGQSRLEMVQNYASNSKSLIIIYPLDRYTIEFERSIGAQEYFKPNLITVVKRKTAHQNELQCLDDVALVKLIYPKYWNCSIYKQQNFYCKLKLRMPRRANERTYCCKLLSVITSPDRVHLVNGEQLNHHPSPPNRGNNYLI